MDAANSPTTELAGSELAFSRTFDAPRAFVFEAWSRPEHVSRWWGPRGFTLSACEMEFRPGGRFRYVMRGPDGVEYPFDGMYDEIMPQERIVFTGDVGGEAIRTIVTFAGRGGKTTLTVRQTVPSNELYARGQGQGWTETLDRLAEHVEGA